MVIAVLLARSAKAERLPVESYTLAQGLASNAIHKIVRDTRGFLWICTGEGLSRFDGYRFLNFGIAQGLPGRDVADFTESRTGDYWVAVNGGLVRLQGNGGYRLEVLYPGGTGNSRNVHTIKEASDGVLWIGTEDGLYRMSPGTRMMAKFDAGTVPEFWSSSTIWTLEEDGRGALWFGGPGSGIGRINNGRVDRWTPQDGFPSNVVVSLYRDTDGTIWAGTEKGLCHLLPEPRPGLQPAERCYGLNDGLPNLYIQSIHRSSDGQLWIGTLEGAAFSNTGTGSLHFSPLTKRQGLIDDNIEAVGEDFAGNVWLGAADDGVMKLSRDGFVLFTEGDGLAAGNVIAFVEDQHNFLYAVTRSVSGVVLNRFDGRTFRPVKLNAPPNIRAFGRGLQQIALQARGGDWWIATGEGLIRYPSANSLAQRTSPNVFLLPKLPDGGNVFRLFEDSVGDVWWSTSGRVLNQLARWSRSSNAVQIFSEGDGLPPVSNLATGFVEDRAGNLWFGFETEGLARRQKNSPRVEYFDPKTHWPIGRIRASYRDADGGLWFGSTNGLWRLDKPEAKELTFHQYTVTNGLSSDTVHSLTGDSQGWIYIGGGKGLDRLDPRSGHIEHVLSGGFPAGIIQAAYRDKSGALWFGTRQGAARLIPRFQPNRATLPAVRITTFKVRGLERPISVAGETLLSGVELSSNEDQIEFAFVAPSYRTGNEPTYQYRLEGARFEDWTPLSSNASSVNFASLPPGSYRFLVRTIASVATTAPATVIFRILPPIWMTWWFRICAALLLIGGAYTVYRYRVRLMLERERLRFTIATDLHDDLGASLSTIAIWSDLAAQQAESHDTKLLQPLQKIGAISREVIDSVNDIVWVINPRHDRFPDLVSRMRRHVDDLAGVVPFSISFSFEGDEHEIGAGPVFRREIFLVFKESLNNVMRHSGCTKSSVSLSLSSGWVSLRVSDDGRGFDPTSPATGNGLTSLRRRAERLGAKLDVQSSPSQGAIIEMRVPISPRGKNRWKKYLRV
jgi:ligand-binding sensor domain-containing protein/signal transduction histidine kinase